MSGDFHLLSKGRALFPGLRAAALFPVVVFSALVFQGQESREEWTASWLLLFFESDFA